MHCCIANGGAHRLAQDLSRPTGEGSTQTVPWWPVHGRGHGVRLLAPAEECLTPPTLDVEHPDRRLDDARAAARSITAMAVSAFASTLARVRDVRLSFEVGALIEADVAPC